MRFSRSSGRARRELRRASRVRRLVRWEMESGSLRPMFSMVLGSDCKKLPDTFKILSFDKQPMEFGRDFSWFECTSNTMTFRSLAVKDSGIFCPTKNSKI
ncbi:BR enhanced expression 2 [Striga asiatica]|uniref:BR enhanced expression 2 n=1 Tax=Striga asiatica TaxID=4170 RepID=A0A5A7Q961_STRAF|nr:BR enhanced expression 2 [Striga asiatica]